MDIVKPVKAWNIRKDSERDICMEREPSIEKERSMENSTRPMTVNNCNMSGIRPAMTPLPYPPIQVERRNRDYANLLSVDYCGGVSEMTAITQYINNENRLSCEHCVLAKMILGIAMAEMMHLQKLGEMIYLLGGEVSFTAWQPGGEGKMWTPAYLDIPEHAKEMLRSDIESERAAISQYRKHISMMDDSCVNATLARIIEDEEYHIMLLQDLLKGL